MRTKPFVFQRYHVFGWIIHRKLLEPGEEYTIEVVSDFVNVDEKPNIWLWTKGGVEGVIRGTGKKTLPRRPGDCSLDRPGYAKGIYDFKAIDEPSEFWCMNSIVNRHELPNLTPLRMMRDDLIELKPGTLLLICAGGLRLPNNYYSETMALEVGESPVTAKAEADTYGLIFDRKRK